MQFAFVYYDPAVTVLGCSAFAFYDQLPDPSGKGSLQCIDFYFTFLKEPYSVFPL